MATVTRKKQDDPLAPEKQDDPLAPVTARGLSIVPQDHLSNALALGKNYWPEMERRRRIAEETPIPDFREKGASGFLGFSAIGPDDYQALSQMPQRANSAGITRPVSTFSQSVVNMSPEELYRDSPGGVQSLVRQVKKDFGSITDWVANWMNRGASGARAIWNPQAERARYEVENTARQISLEPFSEQMSAQNQSEQMSAQNQKVAPVVAPTISTSPSRNTGIFVGGKTWKSGDATGAIFDENATPSLGLRIGDTSAGGGKLIARYALGQSPAAQPGYRGQTIAELGPTSRRRVAKLGGLAGPRFVRPQSREERIAQIALDQARAQSGEQRTSQENVARIQSQAQVDVAKYGADSAAADRDMQERIARVKSGLSTGEGKLFDVAISALDADVLSLENELSQAKKDAGRWTSEKEAEQIASIEKARQEAKLRKAALLDGILGQMQGGGTNERSSVPVVGQVETIPVAKDKAGKPVYKINGKYVYANGTEYKPKG